MRGKVSRGFIVIFWGRRGEAYECDCGRLKCGSIGWSMGGYRRRRGVRRGRRRWAIIMGEGMGLWESCLAVWGEARAVLNAMLR